MISKILNSKTSPNIHFGVARKDLGLSLNFRSWGNLPLFVGKPSLPRAGVAWSSHLTPVLSSRFLRAGGKHPGDGESSGGNGAGDSSGGASREDGGWGGAAARSISGNGAGESSGGASSAAAIGVEQAGGDARLAVAIAGKGVDGGWRMGWCGFTVE